MIRRFLAVWDVPAAIVIVGVSVCAGAGYAMGRWLTRSIDRAVRPG